MTRPRSKPRQYEVFLALCVYQNVIGRTPSARILAEMTGIPMSTVRTCMERLEIEDKWIRRLKGNARHVEIVGPLRMERKSEIQKYTKKALALQEKQKRLKKTLSQKRTEAGKQGRGVGAFIAKSKKKDVGLDARIDQVVAKAKEKEAAGEPVQSEDATLSRRKPWSRRLRVHSVRVG